jgi:hypothetical protein
MAKDEKSEVPRMQVFLNKTSTSRSPLGGESPSQQNKGRQRTGRERNADYP